MAARLVLFAASAAVLVSAQAPTPDPSAGCTSKSFSIPSWFIRDVTYSMTGDVSFQVWNRAINYTASMTCQTNEGWNACSAKGGPTTNGTLEASVQLSGDSATYLVNQTWTCNDRGKPMTFTAVGNSTALQNYTSPILVKGSLTSPVAITPAYPEGPTGHDTPGCTARSEKPSWILSHISYTNRTGNGISAPFVNFNLILTNPANGYEASCMPGTSYDYSADPSHLVCAGNEFQSSRIGRYAVSTQGSYDPDTSTFSMQQTWFCDDTDPAKPLNITASGSIALPFKCTTAELEAGGTETVCVTGSDITLEGKLGTVVTLPPYSIEEPIPARDGCTLSSIFNPRWLFSSFRVDDADSSSPAVSFEIILQTERGFQYPIPIYQGAALESGWYECDIGADGGNGLPLWPYQCSFKYTPASKELVLKADWACQDVDPNHPVQFSGLSTTTINTTLACETIDGKSQCATTDTGYSWVAPISDVTWKST